MESSSAFAAVRDKALLEIDDERLYIVHGDTLGDQEDLFLETLVRGAQASDPADPNRVVYDELDEGLREVINQRVRGS
jgi:UDP-2,3-diacylglucosamine pyrophosphatase LpxH